MIKMIKNIYFDWYDGDKNNNAFGQIAYYDEWDVKLDTHNIDGINKNDFYQMYVLYKKHNKKANIHFAYL